MKRRTVLVIGGTGLLGKALIETCPFGIEILITHLRNGWQDAIPCPTMRVDVTDKEGLFGLLEETHPEVVIHAAGANSVDFAEANKSAARTINVCGTQNVIDACHEHGSELIYISSNAVFSGEDPPYSENSTRLPVNYYGELKVEAENLVMTSGLECAIVRAILMYGWHFLQSRPNPVTTWIRSLEAQRPVQVVDDRYSQPLFAEDCAAVIWRIVESSATGIYHVAGTDRLTLYEFALQTAQVFDLDAHLVEPVPSSYFPQLAPRPVDTSFSILKIQTELQVFPMGTPAGLQQMKMSRLAVSVGSAEDSAHNTRLQHGLPADVVHSAP